MAEVVGGTATGGRQDSDSDSGTKRCVSCGQDKPLEHFAKHIRQKSGVRSTCRACCTAYAKARRERIAAAKAAGLPSPVRKRERLPGVAIGRPTHDPALGAAWDEWVTSGTTPDVWLAFYRHFHGAKKRQIPFRLSFTEWWAFWAVGDRWARRGGWRDGLVMARGTAENPDTGAYEVGNVRCITSRENVREMSAEKIRAARAKATRTMRERGAKGGHRKGEAARNRKPVVTPRGQFPSAEAACDALGVPRGTGHRWARLGQNGWRYASKTPEKPHRVQTPAGVFPTLLAAAIHHEISASGVRGRIKSGWPGWGLTDAPQPPREPRHIRAARNAEKNRTRTPRRIGRPPSNAEVAQARLEWEQSGAPPGAWKAFHKQFYGVRAAKTEMHLTFTEWWAFWTVGDRWARRGSRPDDLCMIRRDRSKPFTVDNIRCGKNRENVADTDQDTRQARVEMAVATTSRAVIDPDGSRWTNAGYAAAATGLPRWKVYALAAKNRDGWRFADSGNILPMPPPTPTPTPPTPA